MKLHAQYTVHNNLKAATEYSLSLSLSILTAIFPGGSGLASNRMSPFWILLELRMIEVVVTTRAIRHAKLQSNPYHQHPLFYRLDTLPVNSVKALKGKSN